MALLKPFDPNSYVADWPIFLRATVILTLLGAIFIWIGLLGVTAILGHDVDAWIFKIHKPDDPSVKICATGAEGLKTIHTRNQQTLETVVGQIKQFADAKFRDAKEANAFWGRQDSAPMKDNMLKEVAAHEARLKELYAQQESIIKVGQEQDKQFLNACPKR
jgi:hypothetical protein